VVGRNSTTNSRDSLKTSFAISCRTLYPEAFVKVSIQDNDQVASGYQNDIPLMDASRLERLYSAGRLVYCLIFRRATYLLHPLLIGTLREQKPSTLADEMRIVNRRAD